ncbi:MAG TPA: hypothetical protein VJ867_10215 [Gemmatimonadaceae bacterium]|nr:hypothetical protein [Gemmatimonadaceae bacterium]
MACVDGDLNYAWNIDGRSASDVFAFSAGGATTKGTFLLHFDGHTWSRSAFGFLCALSDIWPSPESPTVFGVGTCHDRPGFVRTDGATGVSGELPAFARALWGISASMIVAVGNGILRYDGTTWTQDTSPTTVGLNAVHGSAANDIFAVGGNGTILHFDGNAWTQQLSGTSAALTSVFEIAPKDVYVVGAQSTILHYDGTSWKSLQSGFPIHFRRVWAIGPKDVVAIGDPIPTP